MGKIRTSIDIRDIKVPLPYVGQDGNWYFFDYDAGEYKKSEARGDISTVEKLVKALQEGKLNKGELDWLANAFGKGNTQVAGGVVLSKSIILSNEGDKVTSLISGYDGLGGGAFARAGIKGFGTDNETANLELFHNGNAKLGDMHVINDPDGDDDRIEFVRGRGADKHIYIQFGGQARSESDMVSASTAYKTFSLSGGTLDHPGGITIDSFRSAESNRIIEYSFNLRVEAVADNIDYTPPSSDPWEEARTEYDSNRTTSTAYVKITVRRGGATVYESQTETIEVNAQVSGGYTANSDIQHKDKKFKLTIPAGKIERYDEVYLALILSGDNGPDNKSRATVSELVQKLPYDTSKSLVAVTKDKLSFFFSRQKYILFNYLSEWLVKVVGNVMVQGKMEVTDELKAGHVDTSGAVLAGGEYDVNYGVTASFGKYKYKAEQPIVKVEKLGSGSSCYFRVYHSIGSKKYIPYVTASKVPYSDQPSVVDKQNNHFDVRFYNGYNQSYHYSFNYICHKAD